jgi:hypothetical protein
VTGRVAVGVRCHSGWAVLVVVTGSHAGPVVLNRQRVELVEDSLPRQPYHLVAEGARPRDVIDAVAESARRNAHSALLSIAGAAVVGLVAADRRLPTSLDQILASHTFLHAAEGALYENSVIAAAADAGLRVHLLEPRAIQVPAAVENLRSSIGSPWTKDHKWATSAALAALKPRCLTI